ncbi:hypothetical protein WDS03_001499 [Campylobacter upsaliensis]
MGKPLGFLLQRTAFRNSSHEVRPLSLEKVTFSGALLRGEKNIKKVGKDDNDKRFNHKDKNKAKR